MLYRLLDFFTVDSNKMIARVQWLNELRITNAIVSSSIKLLAYILDEADSDTEQQNAEYVIRHLLKLEKQIP